jgi:hypothetical protein
VLVLACEAIRLSITTNALLLELILGCLRHPLVPSADRSSERIPREDISQADPRAQGVSSSRIRKGERLETQAVRRIGVAPAGIKHALRPWRRPDLQQSLSSNASSFARSGRPAESAITFSEPGVWFEAAGDNRQSLYQTAVFVLLIVIEMCGGAPWASLWNYVITRLDL